MLNIKTNGKKAISILLSMVMLLSLVTVMPSTASANGADTTTFIYDDYKIDYIVNSDWGTGQSVNVVITNTGDETIENWMLVYDDFKGNVDNIWNAAVTQSYYGYEYIRNVGHNANILPNQTVNFGYTLVNPTGIPETMIMPQARLERPTSSFTAELNVINDWGPAFNGEIILTNETDMPIEWWELTFDSNFTITQITTSWAATLTALGNDKYTFKGTYTGIVAPNSSVALGFQATKDTDPEIHNTKLTDIVFCQPGVENEDSLVDIGEAYFKDLESDDDIDSDGNGIEFFKNQFLLTANEGVHFAQIEALASQYDAVIVGFIELTNSYQFELTYDADADEIYQIIDELMGNSLVEFASLNTIIESENDFTPNDPWRTQSEITAGTNAVSWNVASPSGRNWGVEAIDAPGAWEYKDQMSTVKVGLIDGGFQDHEDLDFFNKWHNTAGSEHGNHVAGTMAARFNNGSGISGIIPYNRLYAVSRGGTRTEKGITSGTGLYGTAIEWQYMLALLIGNNVKVINSSQNDHAHRSFTEAALNQNANILGNFLNKLINMGYEFVIVSSAGNRNGANANSNSILNRIGIEKVINRIIVVGSMSMRTVNNQTIYHYSSFSDIGLRVDVAAPGGESDELGVYSTVLNNGYADWSFWGTSMASPHVSGVAGLLYSVNPTLSGEQVKEIIVETSGGTGREFTDNLGGSYGIVNAKLAVERALTEDGDNVIKNDFTVYVQDYLSNARLSNATIKIQGTEANNSDVDMYLEEGQQYRVATGYYNVTVKLNGYVTYNYSFHSIYGTRTIRLVENNANNTGSLNVTLRDAINKQVAPAQPFKLITYNENHQPMQYNGGATYTTNSQGIATITGLPPGYYMVETTTGYTNYHQSICVVPANTQTNETYERFGYAEDVVYHHLDLQISRQGAALDFGFPRLTASPDSNILSGATIAHDERFLNTTGIHVYMFDRPSVWASKTYSIGFNLSQSQINELNGFSNDDFNIQIMVSKFGPSGNGVLQTPIVLTASQLVSAWNLSTGFVEIATISYSSNDYAVNSPYWLV